MNEPPAISFQNVSFAYAGRPVLRELSLEVAAGTFAALMGGNGSGKSTLLRLACGLLQPAAGCVRVHGRDTAEERGFAVRRRCGIVFQNPDDQLVASLVGNEVAFGPENLGLSRAEVRERVAEALAAVGLAGFEERQTHSLSGGQKQRLALAGALAMRPQALLLDEASSMLDPQGRADLMRTVRALADDGMTVLMATHDAREASGADRIITLDGGRIASDIPADAQRAPHEREDAVACCISASAASPIPADAAAAPRSPRAVAPQDALLGFDEVTYTYDDDGDARTALRDICLSIGSGELVAIVGRTGSGKSTLIQHANGLLHPTAGCVLLRGRDIASKAAANEARRSVGLVMQYPEQQLFASTVYEDVAFGPENLGLAPAEVDERVRQALDQVGLSFEELAERNPFHLSGGQQRRVAIAGVLAMRPDVLVLDEPCAGLDPSAHAALVQLLADLHAAGQTIIMVTHDLDDARTLATRTIAMRDGRVQRDEQRYEN